MIEKHLSFLVISQYWDMPRPGFTGMKDTLLSLVKKYTILKIDNS